MAGLARSLEKHILRCILQALNLQEQINPISNYHNSPWESLHHHRYNAKDGDDGGDDDNRQPVAICQGTVRTLNI
jgi:hypothetical protein